MANVTVDFTNKVMATDPLGAGMVISEFGGWPAPIVADAGWHTSIVNLAPGHLRCSLAWYGGNVGYGAGGSGVNGQRTPGGATALINAIKSTGALPLVSYNGDSTDNGGMSAATGAALVHHFNDNGGQNGGPIQYWSVGNEPDNTGPTPDFASIVPAMVAASPGINVGAPAAAYWDTGLLSSVLGVSGLGCLSYHAYDAADNPGVDNGGGGYNNTSEYYKQTGIMRGMKPGILYGVEEYGWNSSANTSAGPTGTYQGTIWYGDVMGQLLSSGAHGTAYSDTNGGLTVVGRPPYWGLGIWTGMNGQFKRYSGHFVAASSTISTSALSVYACDNGKIVVFNKDGASAQSLSIAMTGMTSGTYNVWATGGVNNPNNPITEVVTGAQFANSTISYVIPAGTAVSIDVTGPGSGGGQPAGIPGTWTIAFDDEFTGTSLDPAKWTVETNTGNNVTFSAANVIVQNPGLALQVASATSGAQIITSSYVLPVGGCCEARIWFPGPGAPASGNSIYNWPAWWASGPNWPNAGEIDIAESYNGTLTINYHSPSGSHNGPSPGPAGNWSNSWHTYGMVRNATSFDVYFDGVKVYTYTPTDDNGAGQSLLLTAGSGNTASYGTSSYVKVSYVRAWSPSGATAPAAPAGLTVTGTTSSTASLSWTAPPGTVTGYNVLQNGNQVASVTSASATIAGLAASTTYTFTVTAFNIVGTSPPSGSVSATTAAAPGGGGGGGGTSGSLTGPAQGNSTAVCGPYLFYLNEWNSGATETCTYAYPPASFTVSNSQIANGGGGAPGTYSCFVSGNHFGYIFSPTNLQFPIQNSKITPGLVTTSVAGKVINSGAWDFAYDIWFCAGPAYDTNNRLEMMIWLNHFGGIQPAGAPQGAVTLGGVSYTPWVGGPISYVMNSPVTSVTNLDLYPLILDAISRGKMASSWYLIDIEMGFEIWNGGTGLAITSFSTTNGGTSTGGGTAPAAPTGLTVTATTSSTVSLTWTAPSGSVTGYNVIQNGSQQVASVQAIIGSAPVATITGLAASTAYSFAVIAYNAAGTSPASGSVSATTAAAPGGTAPAAPAGLTVAATTSSTVSLAWTAPSGPVTGYNIIQNGSQVKSVQAIIGSGPVATVTGLAASTAYTFTVTAYNAAGTSPASSPVSATTAAAPGGGGGGGGGNGVNGFPPGGGGGGASAGTPGTQVSFTYKMTSGASYYGNDAAGGNFSRQRDFNSTLYQGGTTTSGGTYNGTQKALVILPSSVASDLSGVTIDSVTLKLVNNFSWYATGMTVILGYTGLTSCPAAWDASGITPVSMFHIGQNATLVQDLTNTGLPAALKSGAARSLSLGPGLAYNLTSYGHFYGTGGGGIPILTVTGHTAGVAPVQAGNGADGQVQITYTAPSAQLSAAVQPAAGTDSSGNQFIAGYTGLTRAFQPGSVPAVPETWHPVILDPGWTVPANWAAPSYQINAHGDLQLTGVADFGSAQTVYHALNSGNPLPPAYRPRSNKLFRDGSPLASRATVQIDITGVITAMGSVAQPYRWAEIDAVIPLDR